MLALKLSVALLLCSLMALAAETKQKNDCPELPENMTDICQCSTAANESQVMLSCSNVASLDIFGEVDEGFAETVVSISVDQSPFECVSLPQHFLAFSNLETLALTQCFIRKLNSCEDDETSEILPSIKSLNLSSNLIELIPSGIMSTLPALEKLDLHGNHITSLDSIVFSKPLKYLDISHNLIRILSRSNFESLPSTIEHFDISVNPFKCSADLSWMNEWSNKLGVKLVNRKRILCQHGFGQPGIVQQSELILNSKYYEEMVKQECPLKYGCTCYVTSIPNSGQIDSSNYFVSVDCRNSNNTLFPPLPKFTHSVDLRNNKLNDNAWLYLNVSVMNYNEVVDLQLGGNQFTRLDKAILNLPLFKRFDISNNQLTKIPYDIIRTLIPITDRTYYGGNPWTCTCLSHFVDQGLFETAMDSADITCGPTSDYQLRGYALYLTDPEFFCTSRMESEATKIALLCLIGLFSFLIVVVIGKLSYDAYMYRVYHRVPYIVEHFC